MSIPIINDEISTLRFETDIKTLPELFWITACCVSLDGAKCLRLAGGGFD